MHRRRNLSRNGYALPDSKPITGVAVLAVQTEAQFAGGGRGCTQSHTIVGLWHKDRALRTFNHEIRLRPSQVAAFQHCATAGACTDPSRLSAAGSAHCGGGEQRRQPASGMREWRRLSGHRRADWAAARQYGQRRTRRRARPCQNHCPVRSNMVPVSTPWRLLYWPDAIGSPRNPRPVTRPLPSFLRLRALGWRSRRAQSGNIDLLRLAAEVSVGQQSTHHPKFPHAVARVQ